MVDILGSKELADKVAQSAVELYTKASEYAAKKGIIIADTKFEFGLDENNQLVLVDEVLTPGKSKEKKKKKKNDLIISQILLVSGQPTNMKQVVHKIVLINNSCVITSNLFISTNKHLLNSLQKLLIIP